MSHLQKTALRRVITAGIVAAPLLAISATANAQKPVSLDFGAIFVGSTWYQYAAAMSDFMKPKLPKGSSITVRPYAGAFGNIRLLERGEKINLGVTFTTAGTWAVNGIVAFDGKKTSKVRALTGALDQSYMVIIATKKSGITSLSEVRRTKRKVNVVVLPPTGLAAFGTKVILEGHGITYDDIKKWGGSVNTVNIQGAGNAMKDGRADLWIHPVAKGHPKVTELAQTTDVRFLEVEAEAMAKLQAIGLPAAKLPANTFKHQPTAKNVVGMSSIIITSAGMSDDLAYTLTKAIAENAGGLKKRMRGLGYFDPATSWQKTGGVPLHAGAMRYYKNAGYMK
jgi:TRAP transporter TAXI family solute receptor